MSHPPLALHHGHIPWLLLVALLTTLPHSRYQPLWLSAVTGLILLGVAWQWRQGYRAARGWLKTLLVMAGCAGIVVHYHTLFGRDAGVAMLMLFMALKLLELKHRRDAIVLITLGYFLLLTHYFYSQSIPTGLWLLFSTFVITAALIHLHGDAAAPPRTSLRLSGKLLLQALPFMVVLYLLFPRISGPLWGLPQDAHAGRTGLSDTMSPGSISNLAQSGEIALRAYFNGPVPARKVLYWRGPVLDTYDGQTWTTAMVRRFSPPPLVPLGPGLSYSLTLEAHNQRWLLPLEMPTMLPSQKDMEARMDGNGVVQAKSVLRSRQRLDFTSTPQYRLGITTAPTVLRRNLQLPADFNPRAQALAQEWQKRHALPADRVNAALNYFRNENFVYTLRPPPLGHHAMDDFLFNTRRGFCEHYASAFVILMRAAGVPARIVTGYQGGEINPVDGFLVVRQSDAHAWAEVWLEGQGWVRVDPTAAISPARIEAGITWALPEGEGLPVLANVRQDWLKSLQNRWEAVNNRWNQLVLGYNPERQREFLARLGFPDPDWKTMGMALGISMGTLLLILAAWMFRPVPETDRARAIWRQAIKRLERRGITCPPWETPLALARRMEQEAPELAPALQHLAELVCAARYHPVSPKMEALRLALQQLPRR
ncbi:MAG: DUF3488 and transglutaminase-like domain-containing protein [Azovibrio sp.]|uniref:transglutaminase TgpA family protein n=1 Tax=Azovibrio sp. TaxID=1872673 RepID=UPI003C71F20B